MTPWRRPALVVAIIAVAAVAAAQPVPGPTTVKESECYSCHSVGGDGAGPPFVAAFRLAMDEPLELSPGEPGVLRIAVQNRWTAELRDIEAFLDLSAAPSFGYAARPQPILDQRASGELPDAMDDLLAAERSARVVFETPAGGTTLHFAVSPGTSDGAEAPDLAVRWWGPDQDPDDDAPTVVDSAGHGAPETWRLDGDPVPSGTWTLEVVQDGWTGDVLDRSRLPPQPFAASWDLWFNVSEDDPVRYVSSEAVVNAVDEAPNATVLEWPLVLLQPLTGPERLRVRAVATAFHGHAPQFRAVDEWRFAADAAFTLLPPPPAPADGTGNATAAPVVRLDEEAEPPAEPAVTAADRLRADQVAEMLGYTVAFLISLSLVTGGTFGGWTVRVQEWVTRRRARRIAFHTVTGFGVLAGAVAHGVLFVLERRYDWTVGWLLGGAAILALVGLGLSGAFQAGIARRLGFETWRWLHFALAAVAVAATALHIVLDGIHFVDFQDAVGWEDPAGPWLRDNLPALEDALGNGVEHSDGGTAGAAGTDAGATAGGDGQGGAGGP